MGNTQVKVVMYSGGPFFCYPQKPLLNLTHGADYDRAYLHFRRDHKDGRNLFFHMLCLAYQLTSNYAWLAELDDWLASHRVRLPFSVLTMTSAAWIWTVAVRANAPLLVKISSVGAILAAQRFSADLYRKRWRTMITAQGVFEAMALQTLLLDKPLTDVRSLLRVLVARYGLQFVVSRSAGTWAKHRSQINMFLAVAMVHLSRNPFSRPLSPFLLGFVGWALALLTGQRSTYFYSCAFTASLAQGLSHNVSGELATLPQLSSVADEMAHTTFFPALLLHSVHQSLKATNSYAKH